MDIASLWYLAFFTYLGLTDLLDLLNLKAPMRIEIVSNSPTKLRIYTRSLREPVIEDQNILRFSRSEEEVFLYFLSGKRRKSIWSKPIFPWASTEQCLHIRRCQFPTPADWTSFTSVLEGYPKKLETDILAGEFA